jgi:uncharacterized protein (TIGR02145 family)
VTGFHRNITAVVRAFSIIGGHVLRVKILVALATVLASQCAVSVANEQSTNQAGVIGADRTGTNGCGSGRVGDVNGTGGEEPTIGDVSLLINAKFISLSCDSIPCFSEADINQSGGANPTCDDISIGDISMLIDYLFITGSDNMTLPECLWGTVTDIDGNVYQTVTIGSQVWMAENLRVTHYRNGDSIPNVTIDSAWVDITVGAYCDYNNDVNNAAIYGRLYNWPAVDSRILAPAGWHVPTDAEWRRLEMTLGLNQTQANATGWRGTTEGGELKEAGTTHWLSPNTGATNVSGFSALPGGARHFDGSYYFAGFAAFFWSCTEIGGGVVWHRNLYNLYSGVGRYSEYGPFGYSVRCVKD